MSLSSELSAEASSQRSLQRKQRGVQLICARRARWRPPTAGQASARVICSGSGAEPPLNVLTLRLSARPCPQTPLPAGMESMAEEQESADQSAALGGALRAWLAASLLRLESKSSLAPRAAPETPAGGGATAHCVALFLRCMLLLLLRRWDPFASRCLSQPIVCIRSCYDRIKAHARSRICCSKSAAISCSLRHATVQRHRR